MSETKEEKVTKPRVKKPVVSETQEQKQEVEKITSQETVTSGFIQTVPQTAPPLPYTVTTYTGQITPDEEIVLDHYDILSQIDVSKYVEKKKTGNTELTYLSWAFAFAELKRNYPDVTYRILKFGEKQLPYQFDEEMGYLCWTEMTIQGVTHQMWLPCLDGANKAMKSKPYKYFVKNYKDPSKPIEKTVDTADFFDINKTLMRCLVKNISMFGLGLYIYAGEDLPIPPPEDEKPDAPGADKPEEPPETSPLDAKIAEIHDRVVKITKAMEVAAKVVWAKTNISPIVGNVNYKMIKDETVADKLLETIKDLERTSTAIPPPQ